jgi:Trk K+ transport system NAD-binding subunit
MRSKSFQNIIKYLKAEYRDVRVLVNEFRYSLILFFAVIIGGSLFFSSLYTFPGTNLSPTLPQALHATFSLLFFEIVFPFPDQWYLQLFFFVIPILGVAVLVDGFIRFGTALIIKQNRGQKWQVAMASTYNNHVIVCGMGRIGYRITLELLKFGREIVAIEIDENSQFVEKVKSLDITLIIADARRSENLINANVRQADAIIPCTADELTNLEIALDARELNPDIKVVMRMFDADLAKRVEKGFGIHTAFSTSALAAPIFAAAAMRVDVKHSFYVGDQLQNLSEVVISPDSQLIGWSVEKMENDLGLSFVSYQDGDTAILYPDQELVLKPGAKILIIASIDTLFQINEMNPTTQ